MTTRLTCVSPIDGSLFATRQSLAYATAKSQFARMRSARKAWAARPIEQRIELVLAGVEAVGAINDEIVPELAKMMGRPVRYGGEFGGFKERSTYMASIAVEALADIKISDDAAFTRYIKRVPQGLVFVIAPWNYPYMTAINTIAPALIAGNTVALKHSSQTLLAGERIADAFHSIGVPEDVFANVFLDHHTTNKLIAERTFDYINFTGSVSAGQAIERAAAGTFVGVSTELGGKDPGYVMEDADLDSAVDTLLDGAMYNSGQCCCGIERIYVQQSRYDDFIDAAVHWVNQLRLGNPLAPETTTGPMAHTRFATQVRQQIDNARLQGAQTLIETMPADDGAAYLTPQIVINVDHRMELMREESFGPVVAIMKVSTDKQAIELMNDSHYGLTASLWTNDIERAQRTGDELATGTVFVNRADYVDPALCWTGCKNTGRGGSLSIIGYHNLTRPKSYHMKHIINTKATS